VIGQNLGQFECLYDRLLGQPMGLYLETKGDLPIIGPLLSLPWAGVLFSYGGIIFDLAIVPFADLQTDSNLCLSSSRFVSSEQCDSF
jgi:hypothetical protein